MVVKIDVVVDVLAQRLEMGIVFPMIPFRFQVAEKALDRRIINTVAHPGHAPFHLVRGRLEPVPFGGILAAPVAVQKRVSGRMGGLCFTEGLQHQVVVVEMADVVRHDRSVIQVFNGAQVRFFALPIPEIGDVGHPFFIGSFCLELPFQQVFFDIFIAGFRTAGRFHADQGF